MILADFPRYRRNIMASQDHEEARRSPHEALVLSVTIAVRDLARLPPNFEQGLHGFLLLMQLVDGIKIPPTALPGVIKAFYELQQKYKGQGPARLTSRLGECVEFLKLYQTEMVENGKLSVNEAWAQPA